VTQIFLITGLFSLAVKIIWMIILYYRMKKINIGKPNLIKTLIFKSHNIESTNNIPLELNISYKNSYLSTDN
jgi:hypothetical protein